MLLNKLGHHRRRIRHFNYCWVLLVFLEVCINFFKVVIRKMNLKYDDFQSRPILRNVVVIVWWVAIWNLVDFMVHHMARNDPLRKVSIYIGLLLMVLGVVYVDKGMMEYF